MEVVVVVTERVEVVFDLVEDLVHPAPDVDFAFYRKVAEKGGAEAFAAEGAVAAGIGALLGAFVEEAVDAGGAHGVIAFGVDEEFHVAVEVTDCFADGAHVVAVGFGEAVGGEGGDGCDASGAGG